MKTRHVSLCLFSSAIVLCVQGCSYDFATHEEHLLGSAQQKFEQGDFAGAIRDYTQAIELDPGNGALYHERGLSREALGDLTGAVRDFDSAAGLLPWDEAVHRSRVNAQLALLDSLQRLVPDSLIGGKFFLRMQIVTTRIFLTRNLDRLLSIDPEDTWAHGERGRRRFELGDAQGALEDFNDVLDKDHDAGWAYYDRALAEAMLGDYPAAIRDFTTVLMNDGTDGWAFYQRGLARIHAGDLDQGCTDLRRAVDLGVEESLSAIEDLCL